MERQKKSIGIATNYTDANKKHVTKSYTEIIRTRRYVVKVAEKTLDIWSNILLGIVTVASVTLIPYAVVMFFGGY